MIQADFDPSRIRKCELIEKNNKDMIQFIAIGDRHKMMKTNSGEIEIIKLPEHGKEYRYGEPVSIEKALSILDEGIFQNHKHMAQQIRVHLNV